MLREVSVSRTRAKRARTQTELEEKARQVANLRLGDPENGIEPKSVSETQRIMGYAKNDSIYKLQKIAVEMGLIQLDQNNNPILPKKSQSETWKLYVAENELAKDEYVSKYLKKEESKDVKKTIDNLRMLERFFNTVRITPRQLVAQKSKAYVEEMRDDFMRAFKAGKDWRKRDLKRGKPEVVKYNLNYALASFCGHYGISWNRGDPNMSRKIVGHGKFADIRLLEAPENEYEKTEKWIIDNYGLDSNLYRWFWVGVETCGRNGKSVAESGLYGMKLEWTDLNAETPKETLVMKMFESKTRKVKDGIWKKYIKRPNTIKSLKLLKSRGGTRIYESKLPKDKFILEMNNQLRELFTFLQKDPDSYFFDKPSHTLRHLGAHYWLQKGEYKNHVEVAMIGGWNTVDELIKSYGELPPEKIVEFLDRYDYS